MRLIDAIALYKEFREELKRHPIPKEPGLGRYRAVVWLEAAGCFMTMLSKAPTIEAVPVVRCKDCKHRGDDVCCPMCFEEEYEIDEGDGYFDTDYITHDRTVDDGFCDRGERRADE